jgi:hypothetical protein
VTDASDLPNSIGSQSQLTYAMFPPSVQREQYKLRREKKNSHMTLERIHKLNELEFVWSLHEIWAQQEQGLLEKAIAAAQMKKRENEAAASAARSAAIAVAASRMEVSAEATSAALATTEEHEALTMALAQTQDFSTSEEKEEILTDPLARADTEGPKEIIEVSTQRGRIGDSECPHGTKEETGEHAESYEERKEKECTAAAAAPGDTDTAKLDDAALLDDVAFV